MCNPLAIIAGASVLGAGATIYQGAKSMSAQKQAQTAAAADAEKQRQAQELAVNRENQKQPGIAMIAAMNKNGAKRGLGASFLTGAQGVTNLSSYLGGAPALLGGK